MFDHLKIPARLRTIGLLIVSAFKEWVRDRCSMMAAAMSFNLMLAIAPLIGIAVWLADRIFGTPWTQSAIYPVLLAWYGPRWAALLRFLLSRTGNVGPERLFEVGVLAAFGLIYGASGFFLQLQNALGTIWGVRRAVALFTVHFRKHVFGLGYAVVSAMIGFAGMAVRAKIFAVSHAMGSPSAAAAIRWVGGGIVAFGTFWALMLFLFKVLPPVRLTWRQLMPWAALTAALHLAGVQVLHWIVRHDPATSLVESLVMLLLWFYYASGVFLYGAQLMRVWLQSHQDIARK
ncbi:MAG: ribonuclease [Phycisphaerales bacterium]|nr:ribonuclease [Phycisphaerales bacterium]